MTLLQTPSPKKPEISELWEYNGERCFTFSDGIMGPLMFKFQDGSDMPVLDYMVDGEAGFLFVI